MLMIKLDSSYLEGGGQIVRTALALSTITGIPFEVNNIRKGRDIPGLKNQHIYCVKALEKLCSAGTEGVSSGSTYLKYEPGKINPDNINIDIGTAGSITLMMQAVLLPSLFSDREMEINVKGGTDVRWSMPFDFFNRLLIPHFKCLVDIDAKLIRRGYFPKGNGKVKIRIKPLIDFGKSDSLQSAENIQASIRRKIQPLDIIERGKLIRISGISHASVSLEKAEVAKRQADSAKNKLSYLGVPVDINCSYYETSSPGSGITLFAEFEKHNNEKADSILGADSLGERGKSSESVGNEAAGRLIREIDSGSPIDSHMADNLIPLLALSGGKIKVSSITPHVLANIYTVEKFFGKIFTVNHKVNIISVNI